MRCQPYYVYDNSMLHGPATTLIAVQFRPTAFGRCHSSLPLPLRGTFDSLFSPLVRIIENFETPRFASPVIARVAISRGFLFSPSLLVDPAALKISTLSRSCRTFERAFSSRTERVLRNGVGFSRWVMPTTLKSWWKIKLRGEIARAIFLFRGIQFPKVLGDSIEVWHTTS